MDQQDPRQPPRDGSARPANLALNWRYILPAAAIVAVLAIAFAVQPDSYPEEEEQLAAAPDAEVEIDPNPDPTPTLPIATSTPTPEPAAASDPEDSIGAETVQGHDEPGGAAEPEGEVAGVQSTPTPEHAQQHQDPELIVQEATECGSMQEQVYPVSVEQSLAGVAVSARAVSVYPIDYLRCILLATGGPQATTLAGALGDAARGGATHAVLVDLWLGNSGPDFAQLNLRQATFHASGGTFGAAAVLNGRGEIVVASGQSRNITLVATVQVAYGSATGPITLSLPAPMTGGAESQGKYQLFLPTP